MTEQHLTRNKAPLPATVGTESAFDRMGLEPRDFDQAWGMAQMTSASGLTRFPNPESAMMVLMAGRELGLGVMQAQQMFCVMDIGGSKQLRMWTKAMVAVVRNHPSIEFFRLANDPTSPGCKDRSYAAWEAKRRGDEHIYTAAYTLDEAKQRGLIGRWSKNGQPPEAMLVWRSAQRLIDRDFGEIVAGMAGSDGDEVIEARVDDAPPPPPSVSSPGPAGLKALLEASAEPKPEAKLAEVDEPEPEPVPEPTPMPEPESEPAPASEPELPPAAEGGGLTAGEFHELKSQLAEQQNAFTANCKALGLEVEAIRNLWTGRSVGVEGVKTLRGVRTRKAFEDRLGAASVLLERSGLAVEIGRALDVWPEGEDYDAWAKAHAPALLEDPFRADVEAMHVGLGELLKLLESKGVKHELLEG